MSAKEDLKRKIQGLEDQLKEARRSLADIFIAEHPFQPGDVVMRGRDKFTVSSVRIERWSETRAVAWGKKTLKNGSLGNQEFELYGCLTRVPPEAKLTPESTTGDLR